MVIKLFYKYTVKQYIQNQSKEYNGGRPRR